MLITYMELSEGNNPAVDTENASVFKPISINGHEGTLVVKNSMVTIGFIMKKIDKQTYICNNNYKCNLDEVKSCRRYLRFQRLSGK